MCAINILRSYLFKHMTDFRYVRTIKCKAYVVNSIRPEFVKRNLWGLHKFSIWTLYISELIALVCTQVSPINMFLF